MSATVGSSVKQNGLSFRLGHQAFEILHIVHGLPVDGRDHHVRAHGLIRAGLSRINAVHDHARVFGRNADLLGQIGSKVSTLMPRSAGVSADSLSSRFVPATAPLIPIHAAVDAAQRDVNLHRFPIANHVQRTVCPVHANHIHGQIVRVLYLFAVNGGNHISCSRPAFAPGAPEVTSPTIAPLAFFRPKCCARSGVRALQRARQCSRGIPCRFS